MSDSDTRWKRCLRQAGGAGTVIAVTVVAFALGYVVRWGCAPAVTGKAVASASDDKDADKAAKVVWTCSMHPSVRLSKPGLCPICGMKLIKAVSGGGGLREFRTSASGAALMGIETALVQRRFPTAEVRLKGRIDYDETKLTYITAWVPGRLDRLYVDYTGVRVSKGKHMVKLYSPELIGAQAELHGALREGDDDAVADVREKLRRWGLTKDQIDKIEKSDKIAEHLTINAPQGGIVIHKNAHQGMYVQTGTKIYTIADLSEVWINLQAYETDLPWLWRGQDVIFTSVSVPGKTFKGIISFIHPVLDESTRTIQVRIIMPNPDGLLKPGAVVTAIVRAKLEAGGNAIDERLAGKWTCEMHLEIVKDTGGQCDKCGMDLVQAETLGGMPLRADQAEKPLVIPITAALRTGKRAVVYVEKDPSLLDVDSVSEWSALVATLRSAGLPAPTTAPTATPTAEKGPAGDVRVAKRLWDLFSAELRERLADHAVDAAVPNPLKHRLVSELNGLLKRRDFYERRTWEALDIGSEAAELFGRGLSKLPAARVVRLNRLLLEAGFPTQVAKSVDRRAFEGREIVLGPRAGDVYVVRTGLKVGERVVTKGAFKIDSALQIQAKPSMMTPRGGGGGPAGKGQVKLPARFLLQLREVLAAAEKVLAAVEEGDRLKEGFAELQAVVERMDRTLLAGKELQLWDEHAMLLINDGVEGKNAKDLADARRVAKTLAADLVNMRADLNLGHVGHEGPPPVVAAEFRTKAAALFGHYFALQQALAGDDLESAKSAAAEFAKALAAVAPASAELAPPQRTAWDKRAATLGKAVGAVAGASDLAGVRQQFKALSDELIAVGRHFGNPTGGDVYQVHCPMAFDNKGADWLQPDEKVRNPYLGKAMPSCGTVEEILPARQVGQKEPTEDDASGRTGTEKAPPPPLSPAFRSRLAELVQRYLAVQAALALDNADSAAQAAAQAGGVLPAVGAALTDDDAGTRPAWSKHSPGMRKALAAMAAATDIAVQRQQFDLLSGELLTLIDRVGNPTAAKVYRMHCPMAFDRGADWLQGDQKVRNPYYGDTMLGCGSVTKTLAPAPAAAPAAVRVWTCSMHPQVRLPGPGKCPICEMKLIPIPLEKENHRHDGSD